MSATITKDPTEKKGINSLLVRLRAHPRVPTIIASAFAIAILIAMLLWAQTSDYRVLYNHLSNEDGGAIVTELTQMDIPYRFSENGGALMVPEEKVYELRLRLAQQGLPRGGTIGFELLDKEKFGISQFGEQVNYQRALEGELARTIETFGPVKSARVHLAIPKPTLFVREKKFPSASITLHLQPGRVLDDGQINAVVHMVSSSVVDLPIGNVTVVDQNGRLLTHTDSGDWNLSNNQLKYTSRVESRYQQRIETILGSIVGQQNVHAQVTAQIDFDAREQTEEQYNPNTNPAKSAVRSRQTSVNEQLGGQYLGGVPGALSNQPAPANTAPIETAKSKNSGNNPVNNAKSEHNTPLPSNTRRDDTTNYEVDRTIRHTKMNVGSVKRLSVAVVINHRLDAGGKEIALSEQQLKQIENLTREAMGFSAERGDSINITHSPFVTSDTINGEQPFWRHPDLFAQLTVAGRWLLMALIAFILYRKLIQPQLLNKQQKKKASTQHTAAPNSPSKEKQLQQDNVQGRQSIEVISQRIGEFSENDPQGVAMVIRQWMSNEL